MRCAASGPGTTPPAGDAEGAADVASSVAAPIGLSPLDARYAWTPLT
jgi:hypothetical protein